MARRRPVTAHMAHMVPQTAQQPDMDRLSSNLMARLNRAMVRVVTDHMTRVASQAIQVRPMVGDT